MPKRSLLFPMLLLAIVGLILCVLLLKSASDGKDPVVHPSRMSTTRQEDPHGPNIVLIVMDTARADRFGFMGFHRENAPYLGSLAARGVVFDRAYSTSSWTAPSCASIHTGLLPWQHGVTSGISVFKLQKERSPEVQIELKALPGGIDTIAEFVAAQGYRTFCASANLNVSPDLGFQRGFEYFRGFNDEPAEGILEVVESWAAAIKSAPKYFLYLHFNDPHTPLYAREPWYDETAGIGDHNKELFAKYDSEIAYMDDHIRRLSELLHWEKNTLVIVTADHGEEFMEHGSYGHGYTLYQELTHVPMFFFFPDGGFEPKRISELASGIDIVPTLREFLDLAFDERLKGSSLLPGIKGRQASSGERAVFGHIARGPNVRSESYVLRSVRKGNWHYLHHSLTQDELYFLPDDPQELDDVAASNANIIDAMRLELAGIESVTPMFESNASTIHLNDAKLKSLEDLGYLN